MKDKKLNAELKKLGEDLGKDLWLKQPVATRYLWHTLMASNKIGIATEVLGLIILSMAAACTVCKPEWVFPLICAGCILIGMNLRTSIEVRMRWRKFPKTGKMPYFDESWKVEEE